MTKQFYKHKLLLDENFPVRSSFPTLNKRFDVKHIAIDLHLVGLSDSEVYKLARKENRLLITFNTKDFVKLVKKDKDTGVIGVSANLPLEQIDKKLTALLTKASSKTLRGKLTTLTGESEIPW